MACSLTQTFIQGEVDIPQSGLCDKKLLLVENRNHVCMEGSLQVS